MIEVRIRHVEDTKAVRLCDWDPTDLEGVTRMLSNNGVQTGDGERFAALDSFTTEIVVEDGAAFFEVVLHSQEDA